MTEHILEGDNLHYTYPDGTRALQRLSIAVPRGKKIVVLGANGAGKSTLFLHFNGIFRPQRGLIKYLGQPVSYRHQELYRLRSRVGIVFQDPDVQLFSANVYQEISFGPLNLGLSKAEVKERVENTLEMTGIEDLRNKATQFLSYGQKKLVCLADVLAMEPEVLILDEPTAWLDPGHTQQVLKIIDRLNDLGKTIVFSTHDVELAYLWPDYLFILKEGQVAVEGTPEAIFTNDELLTQLGFPKPKELVYQEKIREVIHALTVNTQAKASG